MPKTSNIPETGIDYENLQVHPLADLLPMIEGEKAMELKKSIEKHGLEQKLILFCGDQDGTKGALRWLDGRNRRRALKELGIKITPDMVETFEGTWSAGATPWVDCPRLSAAFEKMRPPSGRRPQS